jgi:hypothetical protein
LDDSNTTLVGKTFIEFDRFVFKTVEQGASTHKAAATVNAVHVVAPFTYVDCRE